MSASPTFTLGELAAQLQLECVGDASLEVRGLATLASALNGSKQLMRLWIPPLNAKTHLWRFLHWNPYLPV